jgi:hypothetical protein
MIKFEITLPHNDGMTKQDRLDFWDFLDELKREDLEFLLEGNIIKQMRPLKIIIERSK